LSSGAGLGLAVAGPGSDLSEESAVGVEPAALDSSVASVCPPGPAARVLRRSSAIITRQMWSASLRFRQRLASFALLPSAIFRS